MGGRHVRRRGARVQVALKGEILDNSASEMPPSLRRLLAWIAYPLTTGVAIAFALWAIDRDWPAWLVGVVVVVVASSFVDVFERIIPYSKAWATPRDRDRTADFWHFTLSNRSFDIGAFVAISVMTPLGGKVAGMLHLCFWPSHLPLVVQALLALLLVELPWYWIHRLEHRWRPLWRVHSVHHSSRRIYWWNLSRNHPIDNLLSALVSMTPLAFLGVGEKPLALMAAFTGAHAMLQHSNIDQRTGFLDVFLATARVHRWHHSPLRDEADANYGPTLTLWDWVFCTRRFDPQATPPEDVGLGREPEWSHYPIGFVDQMYVPFNTPLWQKLPSGDGDDRGTNTIKDNAIASAR